MDPHSDKDERNRNEVAESATPLRASNWLWRPWYAKLWWAAIPIYWLAMTASLKVSLLAEFYASALAGFLNVLFFPMTAFLVLGVGFARAWFASVDWEFVEPTHEEVFRRPLIDPYTDPNDPLSGAIYRRHHRH